MEDKNIPQDSREMSNQKLNEEIYLRMFQDNPQPMWIYDLETLRFLEVNNAAINDYGYSKEEFLSMTLVDIRPKEDVEALHEDIKTTSHKYNKAGVWRHLKKSGEMILVSIISHELEYVGRKARHVMITDVTEEINYREALEVSESNFRELFENNIVVMLIIDPESAFIVDANKAALNYYGYSKAEMLGLKVYDINIRGTAVRDDIIKVENAEQNLFEHKHRLKNGIIRDVEIFSSRIYQGGKLRLHSIINDVTDKKLALDRIKLLGKAIEQSPVSVLITDKDGNIEYANPRFSETSGYSILEVIGKNPRFLNSGHQPKEFYKEMWETIKSGEIWKCELLNKKKDGSLFWERMVVSPVQSLSGEIRHFVAVKEEITDIKKMINELVMAKEKAEEANRIKTSFLNNMSHEFRTPLISILGYTEILREDLTDPDHIEMLSNMENSGRRLFDTLKAILEISRLEGGKFPINYDVFDIKEVIDFQCGIFARVAEAKKLELTKVLPESKMMVSLDKSLFVQIIDNLLENAIKYTNEGQITVELNEIALPSIEDVPQYEVEVSVKDTGMGIPPEKIETVFEDFRQVSEGYSRSFEGPGLGLSIVKKFTEKMGGRISLESEYGAGCIFKLYFPLITDETIFRGHSASTTHKEVVDSKPIEKHKILLVEDEFIVFDLTKRMLTSTCEVDSAPDGLSAIEKVLNNRYDLILLDINLGPGMDGLATLYEIRKLPEYQSVPVIAFTAYILPGDREYFLHSGCDDYIAKPFTYTQIMHTINKWLGKKE
jgi:PAS domain S-box-containing protein